MDRGIPEVVISDPMRMHQVLANLRSNAVKFTDHGEMVVRAKSHTCDGGDCEAHFAIKDTGIGIPKERIGQLFLPFPQIDATVTRRYGGPDFGLVISKCLVVKMGRLIRIESTPGEEYTFNFTVVAKDAPELKPARRASLQIKGERALVVDDNRTNRMILGHQLPSRGVQPRLASSGKEALNLLEKDTFDIAILDVNMPQMDEAALAKEIRKRWMDTPTLMLTSMGQRPRAHQTVLPPPCPRKGLRPGKAKAIAATSLPMACRCWRPWSAVPTM